MTKLDPTHVKLLNKTVTNIAFGRFSQSVQATGAAAVTITDNPRFMSFINEMVEKSITAADLSSEGAWADQASDQIAVMVATADENFLLEDALSALSKSMRKRTDPELWEALQQWSNHQVDELFADGALVKSEPSRGGGGVEILFESEDGLNLA
ncbi:hypothetical protein [Mycolicibacterium fallax]|uniref:Uncharacterized protein n=1 Tax=Mycolicibacterium fallax TaxID=1793 RepID=A0A1X1RJ48_MYCFA|nr:hypothetical protein [Mycolicibacterium fallax]ORV07526.1 hypothetical protein AWC04_03695 [Mycolicibacterium fallax]BBY99438.1 hypothetical protein MFAL_29050 [Mycolicibacterium fallax]